MDSSEKLQPVPTTFCPNLKTDSKEKIKAVIFDIYGTLLISSSGDIDQASLNKDNMRAAMEAGGFDLSNCKEETCSHLLEQLQEQVKKQHEALKSKGIPFPDVDIFEVWQGMFEAAENKGLLKLSGSESWADIIMVFELLSNRVYPMPGMKEVLLEIKNMGLPIGIVSNAQFYTPIIMNYFLTGKFSTDQHITLFDEDLSVFSYKELRAKPDTALFDKIIPVLSNKYNIEPSETIFVGNDMLKDVYTATKAGVRTVLFAGDERSLRLREDDQRVKGMFPDFIINDLKQLAKIIG
ncbi:HAD family hydrolase [Draconibacterium halophilum]|uniref:HAD family hydrolase n=1 Tax=Draconibacterium halophilum TaxID=2706887 RepID=A0A6C0RDX3_9BACT|nr:HAD family hydrolase [Draconibacterium halophilum]QIA08136.1 HAD family hydrolase [Draconibacterium halophilum]